MLDIGMIIYFQLPNFKAEFALQVLFRVANPLEEKIGQSKATLYRLIYFS